MKRRLAENWLTSFRYCTSVSRNMFDVSEYPLRKLISVVGDVDQAMVAALAVGQIGETYRRRLARMRAKSSGRGASTAIGSPVSG